VKRVTVLQAMGIAVAVAAVVLGAEAVVDAWRARTRRPSKPPPAEE
jgi:hypothetical protein